MLPPSLQTPREVTLYYDALYASLIENGDAVPFIYPWAGIGAFLVLGYLLIDHTRSALLKWLRYPVFAFLLVFQTWCILTNRAKNPAAAFGVGLLSAWGVIWVSSIMVVNDCQADFVRIERKTHDRSVERPTNGHLSNGTTDVHNSGSKSQSHENATDMFYWQSYPRSFLARVDWIADVFCSFRGVGWNWQTSGIPPPPRSVQAQLGGKVDEGEDQSLTVSRAGIRRFSDRKALLKAAFVDFVFGYIALDVIKTTMHHDRYFMGFTNAEPPAYLPPAVQHSHVLLKSYRLVISLSGIYAALWLIFKLGPLFMCGILGPKWIGVRGEAWMNPLDVFGSYRNVLDHGLAGWWGGWWHQTFRYAFETPAARFMEAMNIEKKSSVGRLISLVMAFFLSGCLHAAGSYTQLGETRPLMGPMRFFLFQIVGITFQMLLIRQLSKAGITQKMPKAVKQLANFIFVHVWMYYTAPLLVDDFAKGGVWLFEPIIISPLNALGFGAKDDSWFCWWNGIAFWRSGKSWWDTGIAI